MEVFFYKSIRSAEQVKSDMRRAADAREQFHARMRAQEKSLRGSFLSRAARYLKAEAKHATTGPAPAKVVRLRVAACMACPGRVDEMEGMRDDGGVGFCTKCGCGANQRSKLSVKLTLAGVECPLGKFAKVEGTGGTIASAVEAAKGVAASVAQQIRKTLG